MLSRLHGVLFKIVEHVQGTLKIAKKAGVRAGRGGKRHLLLDSSGGATDWLTSDPIGRSPTRQFMVFTEFNVPHPSGTVEHVRRPGASLSNF